MMANPEIALDVKNSDETAPQVTSAANTSSNPVVPGSPDSAPPVDTKFSRKSEPRLSRKWLTIDRGHHDPRTPFLHKWNKIFLASCLVSVLLDPLFLYIPVINKESKCLKSDENLKIVAVILRLATDLSYIAEIIIQVNMSLTFYRREDYPSKLKFLWICLLPAIARTFRRSYILIDILSVLPFPQVFILIFFLRRRILLRSLDTKNYLLLNIFVLTQYVSRVLRIYLLCKEIKGIPKGKTAIWIKGLLYFFMYILASHVLGAVWYFFAIQQMTVCWKIACRRENGCDTITVSCLESTTRNTTFLDKCYTDTTLFDFGIFTGVLKSDISGSTKFLQKLANCFCWGLRNLSSLGSNLQPSTNTWENIFVAFISIIGLLLFIYLIGNLQTYMQFDTARLEMYRHNMEVDRQMEEKYREVDSWLEKNGVPQKSAKEIRKHIIKNVLEALEEGRHVDLDGIISKLPDETREYIRYCLPLTRLKEVQMLGKVNVDEKVLKEISKLLQPIKYTDKVIIQEGGPLPMMLFIVDGIVTIERRNRPAHPQRGAREYYGEKLLGWPSFLSFPTVSVSAFESVRANGDVEALVLTANDMQRFGLEYRQQFRTYDKLKEQQLVDVTENPVTMIREFSADELRKRRVLGEGARSRIYKGIVVQDGTVVAIKEYKILDPSHKDQFISDVSTFSQIYNQNVVKVLGYCLETEMPLLVYEFIKNGSLSDHIHSRGKRKLSLELRMKIAAEIADTLAFIQYRLPMNFIIQPYITTTQILLDDTCMAKLSGSTCMGRIPEKNNVYSFGTVLAELLTSKRHSLEGGELLSTLLVSFMEEDKLDQILDHEIVNKENYELAVKVANLAKRCLRETALERPSLEEVDKELKSIIKASYGIILATPSNWMNSMFGLPVSSSVTEEAALRKGPSPASNSGAADRAPKRPSSAASDSVATQENSPTKETEAERPSPSESSAATDLHFSSDSDSVASEINTATAEAEPDEPPMEEADTRFKRTREDSRHGKEDFTGSSEQRDGLPAGSREAATRRPYYYMQESPPRPYMEEVDMEIKSIVEEFSGNPVPTEATVTEGGPILCMIS